MSETEVKKPATGKPKSKGTVKVRKPMPDDMQRKINRFIRLLQKPEGFAKLSSKPWRKILAEIREHGAEHGCREGAKLMEERERQSRLRKATGK